MRAKDREYLQREAGRNLELMLRRMSQVTELAPWLPPGVDYAEVRRTAHRLRTGAIASFDPRIPASVLADALERSIEQDMVVRAIIRDGQEYRECTDPIYERYEAEKRRSWVAGFHRLKKSEEASDPESPVAERVRRLSRQRRKELGRPKRRKEK